MQTDGPDEHVTDAHKVSRREFLGGAGAAAGTLLTIGSTAALVAVPGVAQAALRTFAAGRLALEMDGTAVGTLAAAQGGGPLVELLPAGKAVGATGLALSYQPVQIAFGSNMSKPFYDWLTKAVATPVTARARTMSIVAYDDNGFEAYRLVLTGIRLVGFEVPAVNGGSKDHVKFQATLVAESTASQLPRGDILGKTAIGAGTKAAMAANFGFAISGLESVTPRVAAVGRLRLRLAEQAVDPRLRGPWTIEPIELEVAFSGAAPLYQWLDTTLAGKDGERPGVLQFLSVDLTKVLVSIDMPRLGIASVGVPSMDALTGLAWTPAQLYCRDVQVNFAGLF